MRVCVKGAGGLGATRCHEVILILFPRPGTASCLLTESCSRSGPGTVTVPWGFFLFRWHTDRAPKKNRQDLGP